MKPSGQYANRLSGMQRDLGKRVPQREPVKAGHPKGLGIGGIGNRLGWAQPCRARDLWPRRLMLLMPAGRLVGAGAGTCLSWHRALYAACECVD